MTQAGAIKWPVELLFFATWLGMNGDFAASPRIGRPVDTVLVLRTAAAALVLIWNAEAASIRKQRVGPEVYAAIKARMPGKPVQKTKLTPRVQGRITRTDLSAIWPVLYFEQRSADWFKARLTTTTGMMRDYLADLNAGNHDLRPGERLKSPQLAEILKQLDEKQREGPAGAGDAQR